MKKNNFVFKVLISSLILISLLLIVSIFADKDIIFETALYFSKDKVIKPTTIDSLIATIIKILFILLSFNLFLILIFKININLIISRFNSKLYLINWTKIYGLLKKKYFIRFLIGLSFVFFIGICLFEIFNNDIGVNEAFFTSTIKNFYKEGKFFNNALRAMYPSLLLQQLICYPFLLIKPFTSFSIYSLRIVVFIYSLILLLFLMYLIKRKYSLECYLLLLILLISDRSIIFVAASGFGEIPTFLSFLIAVFLWTEKQEKNYIFYIALLFALAGLTKLQILLFIFVLIIGSIIFQKKYKQRNFILLFYTILFWLMGAFSWGIIQGYQIVDIGRNFWRLIGSSSAVISSFPLSIRLEYINNFFNAFNLVIFSIITFYYIKNFKKVTLFEKTIFIFSYTVTLWWVFLYPERNIRNLIYSIIINYILFSIIIVNAVKIIKKTDRRMYFSGFIMFFLIFNFLNSAIFNFRLITKGSDEFKLSIIGYETFSSRRELKSGQDDFFKFINENIQQNEKIFGITAHFYESIFTDKEFLPIDLKTKKISLPKDSYLIITYIDYKDTHVSDDLIKYLNKNAELIFKKNFYEIYKIIK